MLFKEINVLNELVKEQARESENSVIDFAKFVLAKEGEREQRIKDDMKGTENNAPSIINGDYKLFSEETIKSICIKYRLRFLDSKLFKGDIPYEAIQKTKTLEKELNTELRSFKIVAPAARFALKDSTKDPILLAKTANGKYLYIHKWGNDMAWYQKLLKFPFSNIQNLAISSIILSLVISLLIPSAFTTEFYTRTEALMLLNKFMIFCGLSGLIFSASLALGIILSKDFSDDVWNDKYFN